MQTPLQCPVCGSSDIEVREETRHVTVPFAAPVEYSTRVHTCHACDDVFEESEEPFKVAERAAIAASANNIINTLADSGITMAYIERALRLPQRTLARWKAGDCSAGAIALLRIVGTFPGILEVADKDFDQTASEQWLISCIPPRTAGLGTVPQAVAVEPKPWCNGTKLSVASTTVEEMIGGIREIRACA